MNHKPVIAFLCTHNACRKGASSLWSEISPRPSTFVYMAGKRREYLCQFVSCKLRTGNS